jgi:hypothetical protein
MSFSITRATPSQATQLTKIAYAAKAFWNYPEPWLAFWRKRGDMTITALSIAANLTFVAANFNSSTRYGSKKYSHSRESFYQA